MSHGFSVNAIVVGWMFWIFWIFMASSLKRTFEYKKSGEEKRRNNSIIDASLMSSIYCDQALK